MYDNVLNALGQQLGNNGQSMSQQPSGYMGQLQENLSNIQKQYQQAMNMAQQGYNQLQGVMRNPMGAIQGQVQPTQQAMPQQPKYDSQMLRDFENEPKQQRLTEEYFGKFMLAKFGQEFWNSSQGQDLKAIMDYNLREYETQWRPKQALPSPPVQQVVQPQIQQLTQQPIDNNIQGGGL